MFFDNASTTKIDKEIIDRFSYINDEYFYNPGGLYAEGRKSRDFLDLCRKSILKSLGSTGGDLIFTGSASEANNLALFGYAKKNFKVLVSMGEHPSVYNCALELRNRGFDVDFLKLSKDGKVDFDDLKSKMTKEVGLVSIMHVSNETGAINDISAIVDYCKSVNGRVIVHCDGVQAVGKIDVDIDDLGVDMYTMSAHKIHGMKGVGALYVRKGIMLKPVIFGGGQEQGLRSGTENILGVYTLSEAVKNACKNVDENFKFVSSLKERFIEGLSSLGVNYVLNSNDNNSPYIVSVSFMGVRAETLLNMLSDRGVYIGNGSACSSKNSGNRILENMGLDKSRIEGNVRISFSKYNTFDEVDFLVNCLKECVSRYLQIV